MEGWAFGRTCERRRRIFGWKLNARGVLWILHCCPIDGLRRG